MDPPAPMLHMRHSLARRRLGRRGPSMQYASAYRPVYYGLAGKQRPARSGFGDSYRHRRRRVHCAGMDISPLYRLYIGSASAPHRLYIGSALAPHRLHIGSKSVLYRRYIGSTSAPDRLHIGSTSAPHGCPLRHVQRTFGSRPPIKIVLLVMAY